MKDTVLKKQFQEKDIKRMRNLIKGEGSKATQIQLGYKKNIVDRAEGDIWEENGRKWTIKNGIKKNFTKNNLVKLASAPLFCPSCNKIMNKQHDSFFYRFRQTCMDCFYDWQTEMKIEGKWEEYKKNANNKDLEYMKQEITQYFDAFTNYSDESYITEAGDVEKWVGKTNTEEIKKGLDIILKKLDKLKKD